MRDLPDYSLGEWARAAPLAHGVRRLRNVAVDAYYARRPAAGHAALARELAGLDGRFVAFTIAFNLPEAVALLSQGLARVHPGVPLVVCDNSDDPAARARIAALCAARGHVYCALPRPPAIGSRGNASRSHAVALNWVWRNLIRPSRPSGFALLDHDLVPLVPDDLAARVAHHPIHGMVRRGPRGAWYLWPGFSLFDFSAVAGLKLDFGTDTPRGLDTGGQNWRVLYRRLAPSDIGRARTFQVLLEDPEVGAPEPFLLVDGFLHVGGAGHRGGGAAALARVRRAYEADPDGLFARLMAGAVPIAPTD
ncbi:hypothetical protein [Aquabacter spiritensis]|uniref:Glycosyl transferase family 2 n=1 Tax=Aquabacter spiritensis TaxID=933073 RepID=A0A4R3M404_9HYPH|nr:hypothetical protein [Aquabacter spiritensis]TCT08001.1 hypothetical protein EDC64_101520 [Aquabacter spiritensis]